MRGTSNLSAFLAKRYLVTKGEKGFDIRHAKMFKAFCHSVFHSYVHSGGEDFFWCMHYIWELPQWKEILHAARTEVRATISRKHICLINTKKNNLRIVSSAYSPFSNIFQSPSGTIFGPDYLKKNLFGTLKTFYHSLVNQGSRAIVEDLHEKACHKFYSWLIGARFTTVNFFSA